MRFRVVRLGLLLVFLGLGVMGATVANDSRISFLSSTQSDVPPLGVASTRLYPVVRTLRVTVQSSLDFRGKLYVLSESGYRLWRNEDVLDPLVTVDIHGGVSTIFDPPVRGFYGFVIVNELNDTRSVTLRCSDYGWEYDLLTASGVLACVGGVFITIGIVLKPVPSKGVESHRDG